jgi:hypothetical protein
MNDFLKKQDLTAYRFGAPGSGSKNPLSIGWRVNLDKPWGLYAKTNAMNLFTGKTLLG